MPPKGGNLEKLLDHEYPKIHYRTAPEGGSSGSPVFNAQWKLIGLHHKGGESMEKLNGKPGTYQANEGLWIEPSARKRRARRLQVREEIWTTNRFVSP